MYSGKDEQYDMKTHVEKAISGTEHGHYVLKKAARTRDAVSISGWTARCPIKYMKKDSTSGRMVSATNVHKCSIKLDNMANKNVREHFVAVNVHMYALR